MGAAGPIHSTKSALCRLSIYRSSRISSAKRMRRREGRFISGAFGWRLNKCQSPPTSAFYDFAKHIC